MKSSQSSSGVANTNVQQDKLQVQAEAMRHDGYQWTALSVTTVGALLASIQGSALLIALPNILSELQATFLTIMWILLGYLLVLTVLTPVVGRLADLWGRKRLYNSGFIAFSIGSLISGLAQPQFHGADLIAGRVIQGVGAALLVTNSTVIVTDAFKKGQVGLGLGVNQIAGAAGFLIGPIVGGLLTEISWRWVFLFNVPIGIFGAIWGIWRLREPVRPLERQPIDWFGAFSLSIGLAGLLLGLSMLAFPLLPQAVINTFLAIGILGLVLFVAIEPRIRVPLIQLRLFRSRLFALANLSGLLNGIARGAVLFLLIFFLQGPYGKDPLTAGLMLTPFGAAFMLVGPLSGRLSDRVGSRLLTPIGLGISSIALLALTTINQFTPYWLLAVYMALMGGGSGFFVSPNTNAIMSSVEPHTRGAAAGILNMLNNTGMMLSIAIVFPLALSQIPFGAIQRVFISGGGLGNFESAIQPFLSGLHLAFLVSFILSVIAAIVAALRPSHGQEPAVSTVSRSEDHLYGADLSGDHLSNAILYKADLTGEVGLDELKMATVESTSTFRIRIVEEPLTPHNLTSIISAITELSTKCWLIGNERFAHLIEYTQTHDARFVEEAQLILTRITYNSPFDANFKIDLSASNLAEAIGTAIDGVAQAKQRLERVELENKAKAQQIEQAKQKAKQEGKAALLEQERQELAIERERLEVLEKRLDVQKKGIEYALDIATKTITVLHPNTDEQTKAMLIQTLLPTILQLQNGKGLELALPQPQRSEGKTEELGNG